MDFNLFPCNGPQRVYVPPPPAGGTYDSVPCYRVVYPRQTVDVLKANVEPSAQGADDDGFFPINALYVQAIPCRPAECEDVLIFLNEGLRCWSVFLNRVLPSDPQTFNGVTLEFQFKVAAAAINDPLLPPAGLVVVVQKVNIENFHGRVATISGPLCTQVEVWARVRDEPGAQPVEIRLQIEADRLGGQFGVNPGRIAGGSLPIL